MKLPMTTDEWVKSVEAEGMEISDDVRRFAEELTDVINTAYYQGLSERIDRGSNE